MTRIIIGLTDPLRACLTHLAAERRVSVGQLIEEICRASGQIRNTKRTLGLDWTDRNPVGAAAHKNRTRVNTDQVAQTNGTD
jgi:hypothetical protein